MLENLSITDANYLAWVQITNAEQVQLKYFIWSLVPSCFCPVHLLGHFCNVASLKGDL